MSAPTGTALVMAAGPTSMASRRRSSASSPRSKTCTESYRRGTPPPVFGCSLFAQFPSPTPTQRDRFSSSPPSAAAEASAQARAASPRQDLAGGAARHRQSTIGAGDDQYL